MMLESRLFATVFLVQSNWLNDSNSDSRSNHHILDLIWSASCCSKKPICCACKSFRHGNGSHRYIFNFKVYIYYLSYVLVCLYSWAVEHFNDTFLVFRHLASTHCSFVDLWKSRQPESFSCSRAFLGFCPWCILREGPSLRVLWTKRNVSFAKSLFLLC